MLLSCWAGTWLNGSRASKCFFQHVSRTPTQCDIKLGKTDLNTNGLISTKSSVTVKMYQNS